MMHTLTITENDHLAFQLYDSSTNPIKIKTRRNSYITFISIVLILGIFSYFKNYSFLFWYMVACLAIFILFYNPYMRYKLKKHYTKYIKDTFRDVFNERYQLEITDEYLITTAKAGESKIKLSEIINITEIPGYFFIKISTGPSLIVTTNSTSLNQEITALMNNKDIPYIDKLNWKWNKSLISAQ